MIVSTYFRACALAFALLPAGVGLAASTPQPLALPTLTISSAETPEGNSGTKQMVFTVSLSSASTSDVSMNWGASGGTAGNDDYVKVANAHLVIPAGATSRTISVTINGDTVGEADEYFYIEPDTFGGAVFDGVEAKGWIRNDDALPGLSLTGGTVIEGADYVLVTARLPSPAQSQVDFELGCASGTATQGSDFGGASSSTFSLLPGQSELGIHISILNDAVAEGTEAFSCSLANVTGATVSGGSAQVTIFDYDGATGPKLALSGAEVIEGDTGTRNLVFRADLLQPAANDVTFDVQFTGFSASAANSASAGSDFLPTTLVGLRIPAGQASVFVPLPIVGDTLSENDEYVTANLANVVGAGIWDPQVDGLIHDNDNSDTSLFVSDLKIAEGNSGTKTATVTVSVDPVSNRTTTFNLDTRASSALEGSDFVPLHLTNQVIGPGQVSKTFSLTIVGDATVEQDEMLIVEATQLVGASQGRTTGYVTILNDDLSGPNANPKLTVDDASIVEGNSGTKNMTFTVRLSAPTQHDVTYLMRTADFGDAADSHGFTATPNDYVATEFNGRIPAGSTTGTFTVPIRGDTLVESGEVFMAAIDSVSGAYWDSPRQARGTILNDDPIPQLNLPSLSVHEGDEGTSVAYATLWLDRPSEVPVTFNLVSSNGSAVAGSDYVALNITSQTIPPGEQSKVFSFTIMGDTTAEQFETFNLNVTNVSGATAGAAGTVTIIEDDEPPQQPVLILSDVTISEGNSGTKSAIFTASLSFTVGEATTFDVSTSQGSAKPGEDFVATTLTGLTIPANQVSTTFAVPIIGDTVIEADEYFRVAASNVRGGGRQGSSEAIGNITNDDFASLPSLSIGDRYQLEGNSGSRFVSMLVGLSAPTDHDVTVRLATADGSALAPGDYTAVDTTVTIPASSTSLEVLIPIVPDTLPEADPETFLVNLSDPVGASIADGQATVMIGNDDGAALPTLSIADVSIAEGNSSTKALNFVVTLSAPATSAVTFDIATANGSAIAGSDYGSLSLAGQTIAAGQVSKTVSVTINGDTTFEPDETFTLGLANASGATIADGSATGTITNDDVDAGGATLSIADVAIVEGNSGTRNLYFTVKLSAAQAGPVSFDIATANGTATAGSDYLAKSQAGQRIAAGSTSKQFVVTSYGDTVSEADEIFTVNLSNAVGATIADAQATGTITNDDAASSPTLSIADASISEGDSGTKMLTFTLSLSGAASGTVSYDIATGDGTATAGSDYVGASLVGQSIAAGVTSKTFSVTINGDTTVEPDESFNVTVSNVSGATLGDGSALGTITNDDTAVGPTLSIGDVSIIEGNSGTRTLGFKVTLSAAQASVVQFDLATMDGTATAGSDYVAKALNRQQIAAGSTQKIFSVTINGDTTAEADETFLVRLANVTGAVVADGEATGTIANDDGAAAPTLSIGDLSIAEGNSGTTTATFTVSLSGAADTPVTYDIATSDGSATAGSDYVAASLVGQGMAAGVTSKTFSVTINGDTTVETDENFIVNVTNVTGATLGDGSATGTISNDDAESGPTLSVADVSIAEGDSGTRNLSFTVRLSVAQAGIVQFDAATADGSAVAGSDYVAKTLKKLQIGAGLTSKTFTVTTNGDTTPEADETFYLRLSNAIGATIADGEAVGTIGNDDVASLTIGRFDAQGLVDDVDDGNREPRVTPTEYATLLLDAAQQLCRRAPGATVVAVEGVEHREVLADMAEALMTSCAGAPRYSAVMAQGDTRGFLIEAPADPGVAAVQVLGAPEMDADARSTTLVVQGAGHDRPLALVLAATLNGTVREREAQRSALAAQLRERVRTHAGEAMVLLGMSEAEGFVDLTARELGIRAAALSVEPVLVNRALIEEYARPRIELPPMQAGRETPTPLLRLGR